MNISERIKYFILKYYDSIEKFSDISGIGVNCISGYIDDYRNMNIDDLKKFLKAGMSVEWLLSEEGSMFANNFVGEALQSGTNEAANSKYLTFDRMRSWAYDNYESIKELAKEAEIDYDNLYKVIFGNFLPDVKVLKGLKKAGCNINWLFSGTGSKYENNIAGIKLKLKVEGIKYSEEDEYRINQRIMKILKENSKDNLYTLIKQYLSNSTSQVNENEN